MTASSLAGLQAALADLDPAAQPLAQLETLVQRGLDRLPLPGSGATLQRWQALAAVAAHDLSLAKLFEGHTDAVAILQELEPGTPHPAGTWGTWAAEAPGMRTGIEPGPPLCLRGAKAWCSGAAGLSHGLLTAWWPDGRGPQLVRVALRQPGVAADASAWQAVGMAGSASIDVAFAGAQADTVGPVGAYLARPGFWQGGAGIAACWYGGAQALAAALHRALQAQPAAARSDFRRAALGKVDLSLHRTAAVLREAAMWIDAHPLADASQTAWRARLAAEDCARQVLDEAGRALGAGAFCRDLHFARLAADLPVFVRQSHAERDFAALGGSLADAGPAPWAL